MNKFEFEHMISLVDEKYIDEMFTDRIHNRKKNLFAGFGAVAAVLALILGIGFISGKINNGTDDIVADTTPDSILIDEPVDYSQYFNNDYITNSGNFDAGWMTCLFEAGYIKQFMPFDTSSYDDSALSRIYFDYKDEIKYYDIDLSGLDGVSPDANRNVHVLVGEEGSLFSLFSDTDKYTLVERFGVEVYGAEDDDVYERYGFTRRILEFSCGGKDYSMSGINMTYDEIGMIMDSIIKNGIPVENIDLSEAFDVEYRDVNATISLAEANEIKPFAGCVPQLESIGDMQFYEGVDYFAGRDIAHQLMPEYIYYTYYDGDSKDICVQYFTEVSDIEPSENTLKISDNAPGIFSDYGEDGNVFFTIECDGFKINIWTNNCTQDEIYSFTSAVESEISGYGGRILESLSEANEIEPFAGFVPQLDTVGSLTLKEGQYNNYINGKDAIVIWYETPSDDVNDAYFMKRPYIQVSFDSVSGAVGLPETGLANYVTLEELTENVVYDFADQAGQSGHEGCSFYSMTVDCGKFTVNINADCTPGELWMYLREIAKAYDGSDIAYGGEHHREGEEVTLEYANEATAFAGFVPQTETIGELYAADVEYNKLEVNYKIVDSYLHIEYLPNTSYNSQYIITEYQQDLHIIDSMSSNVYTVKFEDLTEDSADEAAGIATYPENNFYRFAISCGEFYIYIAAECPEETMREYLRAIIETSPKYTALTLEEAEGNELTGGLVPQLDKIGDMTLEDGYCRVEEFEDGIQFLRIKYRNTDFKYQNEEYDYYGKYISVGYTKKTGAITSASKFNDIESAINSISLNDSGVSKYVFGIDCGDFYIGVQALCNDTELQEYLDALKALETNTPQ